jgi:dTDP-4-amino-4,6-dideoxygalactose transaminase
MINVTTPFLPPLAAYEAMLKGIWERKYLTNNGPLVVELENKLKEYLSIPNLLFTNNGTVVLQMALRLLENKGEVITTPFSYVATTNAILWEGFTPVFADIQPFDFNIDPEKIEAAITENTVAILATHVYGNPCHVEAIEAIAVKNNIMVIYDAAHAFGSIYKGKQILSYGDIATCSFHATKVFHTVEGGCIISRNQAVHEKLKLMRSFGHVGDEYFEVGINGKNSEFHAAMGLCNLPFIAEIIEKRKILSEYYTAALKDLPVQMPKAIQGTEYNYAYYPVVFQSEEKLLNTQKIFMANQIFARRYFYPSLNQLPFLKNAGSCPVSEKISTTTLSLPMSTELNFTDIDLIVGLLKNAIDR